MFSGAGSGPGWCLPSWRPRRSSRAGDLPQPDKDKLDAAQEEFFEAKVRPVLADNCLECHGAEKHKGGLRLDVA